jgi:hypothetical protein
MQLSSLFLILAASAATFGAGQALLPTAQAQPIKAPAALSTPPYRVRVEHLHTKRTASGIEVTGQIVNTGCQSLTYTSLVTVCTDETGRELARGDGYLTAGPVRPGQAAGFRGSLPETPAFTDVTLVLHEAGHPVTVDTQSLVVAQSQAADKH